MQSIINSLFSRGRYETITSTFMYNNLIDLFRIKLRNLDKGKFKITTNLGIITLSDIDFAIFHSLNF